MHTHIKAQQYASRITCVFALNKTPEKDMTETGEKKLHATN
jgi:hypothetical protein